MLPLSCYLSTSYKALNSNTKFISCALLSSSNPNMSNTCDNCDCADKSGCTKGNNYGLDIVETEKSYMETGIMDVPAAEHDGKCKCGPNCTCVDCNCGH
ncbi:hypothetical protein VNO78_06450 [Psophocarpus tetragonolobus]|uniref:Uncharacterized protein n=1 Tax=Psophocarpus tetragonolobus TaxID=3891 RepID=A0AAN9SSH5_PSOTE